MLKKPKIKLINNSLLTASKKNGVGIIEFLLSVLVLAVLSAATIPALFNKANIQQNKNVKNTSGYSSTSVANETNYNISAFKQLYKTAYSDASQTWKQLYNEGTLSSRQGWASDQANYDNFTQFMTKFNAVKQCTYPNNSECWAENETQEVISGHPSSSGDRCFMDISGRTWCEASYWGWFTVDVNGLKTPNQFGKDRFIFYTIAGNDITAAGIPDNIIVDSDYSSFDANKCPNPPCYYTSWISQ